MPKPSHRNKLLTEGLKVLLTRGYVGASVRDIVKAAGAPQGSFTNHFTSKEAFAEEVLDLYFSLVRQNMEKTLRNDSLPPLHRLRQWIDLQIGGGGGSRTFLLECKLLNINVLQNFLHA